MTLTLNDLGWTPFFTSQCAGSDPDLTVMRVTEIHRDRMTAITTSETFTLTTPPEVSTGTFAVGDWVLVAPDMRVAQTLARKSLLSRRAAGTDARTQLIAANVDTLFITTSCNPDFNPARLERYLAMAKDAGTLPVVVLTKADLSDQVDDFVTRTKALAPDLEVLAINAKDPADQDRIMALCGHGQTAALLGSSGVGKSTLLNALTGETLATAGIRETDARGRHTTTARTLRRMRNGGWIIDTPGMRALPLNDASDGIDALFDEVSKLSEACKFNNCSHEHEPGCAVREAVKKGELTAERVARWQKLRLEEDRNAETMTQTKTRHRGFAKQIRKMKHANKGRKGY
jgi:ribosome biogenesis GTPase / thiamine phosphate phosphatase